MRGIHEPEPYLQHALAEHHDLHHAVVGVSHRLAQRPKPVSRSDVAAMKSEISQIRDKLALHFLHEEDGGYLEEAIGRLPSVAPAAATLQREHGELLELADAIIAGSCSIVTPQAGWDYLADEFGRFRKRLLRHEAAENALLSRAFNVDLSAET